MVALSTSQLSSKGQIVIPEDIRNQLGLTKGARFVVYAIGDAIMLKRIATPSNAEIKRLLEENRRAAKRAGLKRSDVSAAIKRVRAERKSNR